MTSKSGKKSDKVLTSKPVKFLNLLPYSISPRSSKEDLNKSKFYGKNHQKPNKQSDRKKKAVLCLSIIWKY